MSFLGLSVHQCPLLCLSVCLLFPLLSYVYPHLINHWPGHQETPSRGRCEDRNQATKEEDRKRRNRGGENTIRAWSPKNVNSRAIAFRLHAQMNYNNNNNNNKCRRWVPEIRRLWQRVKVDCEWQGPRAPTVRALFGNP